MCVTLWVVGDQGSGRSDMFDCIHAFNSVVKRTLLATTSIILQLALEIKKSHLCDIRYDNELKLVVVGTEYLLQMNSLLF